MRWCWEGPKKSDVLVLNVLKPEKLRCFLFRAIDMFFLRGKKIIFQVTSVLVLEGGNSSTSKDGLISHDMQCLQDAERRLQW